MMGGYNMMFSFCLLIGHIAAVVKNKDLADGQYGKAPPVIYGVGFCCGILGFVYGFIAVEQYKKTSSLKYAILMRDLLFSFNIGFGVADS